MLTVAEAWKAVERRVGPLAPQRISLHAARGLRLAEDVISGVDSPPFDKSVVDGFAISTGDASPLLRIAELVTAGATPTRAVERGTTLRVMTGAPLPDGADAVVKWEDCEPVDEFAIHN
ncbi:MAG TPA: hypothetical protein PJ982_14610, partial [Lacipirellulaceae bacterium]|nr:hypothetical protein [Lacipirellulaceae bacterium]